MKNYDFYVVGIGSSAGGLDPLRTIISNLPKDINAAIIVAQHLPAGVESKLDVLLQRITDLQVVAVETIEFIEPGKVYVMAVGKQLLIDDQFVLADEREPEDKVNRTIDHCFFSIAKEFGPKATGIILSGAGYDGLEGANAIEEQGGIVIVQDPITADFPLMPQTLIANDHPDYVLTPEDISIKLAEHVTGNENVPV